MTTYDILRIIHLCVTRFAVHVISSIQSRLDENAARLINLHRAHNERLSKVYDSLESFSSRLPQPTEQEQSLGSWSRIARPFPPRHTNKLTFCSASAALQVANELKQLSAQVRRIPTTQFTCFMYVQHVEYGLGV